MNIKIQSRKIDAAELAVDNFKADTKNWYNKYEMRDDAILKLKKLQDKVSKLYDELVEYLKANNITDFSNYELTESISIYLNECVEW